MTKESGAFRKASIFLLLVLPLTQISFLQLVSTQINLTGSTWFSHRGNRKEWGESWKCTSENVILPRSAYLHFCNHEYKQFVSFCSWGPEASHFQDEKGIAPPVVDCSIMEKISLKTCVNQEEGSQYHDYIDSWAPTEARRE